MKDLISGISDCTASPADSQQSSSYSRLVTYKHKSIYFHIHFNSPCGIMKKYEMEKQRKNGKKKKGNKEE